MRIQYPPFAASESVYIGWTSVALLGLGAIGVLVAVFLHRADRSNAAAILGAASTVIIACATAVLQR